MNTIPTIAFDESGNTGANLLDPEQPVFALASVYLEEKTAKAIVGTGGEFKFSRLKRSKDGRSSVLNVLNHEALAEGTLILTGFHKRFMVVTKIVDLLYEPLAHAAGIDLYERGANLALSNVLFATLPTFIGTGLFEEVLMGFVRMIREPTEQSVDTFYRVVKRAYDVSEPDDLQAELGTLLASRTVVEKHLDSFSSGDLDPAIPAFVQHSSEWTRRLNIPFRIIHDSSKPLLNEQIVLEAMMSVREVPTEMGYDRRKFVFPIAATGIEFADSVTAPAIQIADLIASSASYVLRSKLEGKHDLFADQLLGTRVLSGSWAPVWPSLKVTPEDLETDEPGPRGIDVHESIGKYVSRRLGGIPPVGQRRKSSE
jgi:hypothetical protein